MNQEIEQLDIDTSNSEWNNKKNKKKLKIDKKTVIVVVIVAIIAIVIFIAANNGTSQNNQLLNEDGTIVIDTGTTWGDAFANYVYQEMGDMTKYDVAFVDLNNDNTPEMLFRYLDNDEKDSLKIFYLYRDEVLATNIFHNYSLHLLYSVKDKNVDWYIYFNYGRNYGDYSSLTKIINGTARDSDIKVRTDKDVEAYKRAYVDGKYSIVFYEVKTDNFIDDFTTVVGRYGSYKAKIDDTVSTLISDNSELEYEEVVEKNLSDTDESFVVRGCRLKYGSYYALLESQEQSIMIVNKDKTITFNGKTYNYSSIVRAFMAAEDDVIEISGNDTLHFNGVLYTYGK